MTQRVPRCRGGFVLSATTSSPIYMFVKAPGKTYTVQVDRNQRAMRLYILLKSSFRCEAAAA